MDVKGDAQLSPTQRLIFKGRSIVIEAADLNFQSKYLGISDFFKKNSNCVTYFPDDFLFFSL